MTYYPPVSPYAAGFGGKCPRCGQGALFKGFLSLHANCSVCDLDFAKADSGDGPAFFVMSLVSFFAVALAFIARFVWDAPMGLALFVSIGFTVAATLLLLRPMKATLIALQYANNAEEGRLEE